MGGFYHGSVNSDDYFVLAGGGTALRSGYATAHSHPYVKLDAGVAEQTIKSSIGTLSHGVIDLWRNSGDHYTFLGFSNGTTETYLGGIGFKSLSDANLYRKAATGSDYYKIADASNIVNKNATIGTSLTTIATIAGVDIKAKIASYALASHTHNKLDIRDVRGTNWAPSSTDKYPNKNLATWFNNTGMPESSTWYSGITMKGWEDGYNLWLIAGYSSNANKDSNLYFRNGIYLSASSVDAWKDWRALLDSKNYHAIYRTTSSTSYIKIAINSTKSWMLSFVVRVYQDYNFYDIVFSGYNYGSNYWYSPKAVLRSSTANTTTVYFGYTSANNLWVAIAGSNYTGVEILECVNGFYAHEKYTISELFTITAESSLPSTVQKTDSSGYLQTVCNATTGAVTIYRPWYRNETPITVTNSGPTLGTSATTIATIGGTAITAKVDHTKTSPGAGTAGTSSATSGSTLYVPYVTVNANGHVTNYGTHLHTISGFSYDDHTHAFSEITDKILTDSGYNEFNFIDLNISGTVWINKRNDEGNNNTNTITEYDFGKANGSTTYASLKAEGYIKNGSSDSYVLLGGGGHKLLTEFTQGKRWTASIKGATWSRICYVAQAESITGSSFILNIKATRSDVVYNHTYLINTHHSNRATIVCLNGSKYEVTEFKIRCESNTNGAAYIDIYDQYNSATTSTSQTVYCTLFSIRTGSVTGNTSFVDGTTVVSGYTATELVQVDYSLTTDSIMSKFYHYNPSYRSNSYLLNANGGVTAASTFATSGHTHSVSNGNPSVLYGQTMTVGTVMGTNLLFTFTDRNGTSDFTDGTELLSSYANNSGFGTTGYVGYIYRRPASAMWNYIKSKTTCSVNTLTSSKATNLTAAITVNGVASSNKTLTNIYSIGIASRNSILSDSEILVHFKGTSSSSTTATTLTTASYTDVLTTSTMGDGNKVYYPYNGTASGNSQVLRLFWGASYWKEIFSSPNNKYLFFRGRIDSTILKWHIIPMLEYPNTTGTLASQATLGSATKPVYISEGKFVECNTYPSSSTAYDLVMGNNTSTAIVTYSPHSAKKAIHADGKTLHGASGTVNSITSFVLSTYVPLVTDPLTFAAGLVDQSFGVCRFSSTASGATNSPPSSDMYHIISSRYGTASTVLTMPVGKYNMWINRKNGSSWSGWKKLLVNVDTMYEGVAEIASMSPLSSTIYYSPNMFFGTAASQITVEYSTNSGSTWTNYGASNDTKLALVNDGRQTLYLGGSSSTTASLTKLLRITIDANNSSGNTLYCMIFAIIVRVCTNGQTCNLNLKGVNYNNGETVLYDGQVSGWAGENVLGFNPIRYGGGSNSSTATDRYRKLVFTFSTTALSTNSSYTTTPYVMGIRSFTTDRWTEPSGAADYVTLASGKHVAINPTLTLSGTSLTVTVAGKTSSAITLPSGGGSVDPATTNAYGTVKIVAKKTTTYSYITTLTTSRYYGVQMDNNGKLFVNVPNMAVTLKSLDDVQHKVIFFDSSSTTYKCNLYYSTQFYVTQTGVYFTSDRNLKTNILQYILGKELVENPIKKFNWKIKSSLTSVGFIAQEIEEWCPEAVGQNEDGYKTVNYNTALSALCGYMFDKIKKLEQTIQQLEEKLNINKC